MLELTELIGHIFVVTMISYFVGREGEGGERATNSGQVGGSLKRKPPARTMMFSRIDALSLTLKVQRCMGSI